MKPIPHYLKKFLVLILAVGSMASSGCSTYMGYHTKVVERQVSQTIPITKLGDRIELTIIQNPAPNKYSLEIRTTRSEQKNWNVSIESQETKIKSYRKYHLGLALSELVVTPILFVTGPLVIMMSGFESNPKLSNEMLEAGLIPYDIFARLFGAYKMSPWAKYYNDHPPGYFCRLSQCFLIGGLNPFQVVYMGKEANQYKNIPLGSATVRTEPRSSIDKLPLAQCKVKAIPEPFGDAPILEITDDKGHAILDLTPWEFNILKQQGQYFTINLTASKESLTGKRSIRYNADNLIGPDLIKRWFDKLPLEQAIKGSGLTMDEANKALVSYKNRVIPELLQQAHVKDLQNYVDTLEQEILKLSKQVALETSSAQRLAEKGLSGVEIHRKNAIDINLRIQILKPILAATKHQLSIRQ